MRGSFREELLGGLSYCLEIQLSEQVDEQDVEYIPSPSLRVGTGAGVQLLGNLLVQAQTANGDGTRRPIAASPWIVDMTSSAVPLPAGPRSTSIVCQARVRQDGHFQPHRIHFVHLERFALEQEAELVEAKGSCILKAPQPLRPFTRNADVDVFRRLCSLGKSQFERDATLEIVAVQYVFMDGSLQNTAEGEE